MSFSKEILSYSWDEIEGAILNATPQDVEWAYRDGRFLILQSRNITALSRSQTANMKEFVQERERRRLLDLCAGAAPDEPVFVLNELSELLPRPTPFSLSFMEALWQPGGSTDLACRALRIRYDVEENGSPFVTSVFGALYVNRREEKRRLKRGMGFLTNLRLTRMAEKLERDFRDDFLPEFHHEIRVYEAVDESRLKTDELFILLDHVCQRFVTVNYGQAHIVNIAAREVAIHVAGTRLLRRLLILCLPHRFRNPLSDAFQRGQWIPLLA